MLEFDLIVGLSFSSIMNNYILHSFYKNKTFIQKPPALSVFFFNGKTTVIHGKINFLEKKIHGRFCFTVKNQVTEIYNYT